MEVNGNYKKYIYLAISLVISYFLFSVVTPWVFSDLNDYKRKNTVKTFSDKIRIPLVDGICDFGTNNLVNCSDKSKPTYLELPVSMNKEQGIEFSYTFWTKLNDPDRDNIIFTKGIFPKTYTLGHKFSEGKSYDKDGVYKSSDHTKINEDENNVNNEQLVKCPTVRISKKKLTVTFNTLKKIHNVLEYDFDDHGLLNSTENNPRWFLFSLAFREGLFKSDYGLETKGVIIDLYINEEHIKSKFIDNDSLKLNDADVHFFPEGEQEDKGNRLGNLDYYNYALTIDEVKENFYKGFNNTACNVVSGNNGSSKNNQINSLGQSSIRLFD